MAKPRFYIHRLRDLYARGCEAEIRVERQGTIYTAWVRAVCEPYTAGSLFAAWEVLCGRAFAFEWPKAGDIEAILAAEQSIAPQAAPTPANDSPSYPDILDAVASQMGAK